jgi:hypothetical protein
MKEKIEVLADLYELKMNLLQPFNQGNRLIEQNTTYVVIETLIAVLMDKYKIKYEEVVSVLQERKIK